MATARATAHDRLAQLQDRMRDMDFDLAIIGPTPNMRYLLGFTPHADERLCLLLVGRDAVNMLVPGLNAGQIAAHTDVDLHLWDDADGPGGALQAALAQLPAPSHLAIDGAMRADFLLHLQQHLTPETTSTSDVLLAPLRERKSPAEIERLVRAARQADEVMQVAIDACEPGVTEAEVAWAVEAGFRQRGAEKLGFAIVASGPNSAYPHHDSGERVLEVGDAVVIDIGASLDGYQSDITRMIHLGAPSDEFLAVFDAVREANQQGRAAVQPGATAHEVDLATRSVLEGRGLGEYFVHRTGHGLGLEGHEPPWIMAGNHTPLTKGMVFSVEPGAYLPGKFGVRVEDIVAVTDSGCRTLTGFSRNLVVKA